MLQAGNGILRIGKITYYENSKWSFFANGINGSGEIRLLYCILIRNWQMQNRRECDFVMTRRGLNENSKWSFFANGINGSGEIRLLYCILIRNWQMQNRRECDFVMTRRGLIGIIILSNILKGRKALKYLPIRNI